MLNKDDKKPIKAGLLAGFIASLCCIGPLILIFLGIGGAGTALAIGKQSPYFLGVGVLILAAGLGLYYFRQSKTVCSENECEKGQLNRKKAIIIVVLACASFLAIYYALLYILVPWLAPIVYQNFYN